MIASLFRKSTPFNYTVLIVSVTVFYLLYEFTASGLANDLQGLMEKTLLFGLVFASLFVLNFIVKKNGLSRDNSYAILFYFLFLLFFPSVFDRFNLAVSNFFILLALRRLVSLQSLKAPREKIFDASLWIFLATAFHFWCILFIVLVFISILFHAARDYRNWILPFIAFFTAATTLLLFALVFDETRIGFVLGNMTLDWRIDYFTQSTQNLALSLFTPVVVYVLGVTFMTLSQRPLIQQSSFKKIISAFGIAVVVFLLSPGKSNELLVYTFAPLSILFASLLENTQNQFKRELIAGITAALAIVSFFVQI